MHVRSLVGLFLFALVMACAACTVTSSSPGLASSSGGASVEQVTQCKRSCDKMKFFDCNSADEQARCYGDCDKASASQVQVFVGCASNSICDPACRTNITPADQPKTGTGASGATCATACEKLVSCSFLPLGKQDACLSQCARVGYQYQIDCVNKSACGEISSKCGGIGETSGPGTTGEPPSGLDAGLSAFDIEECQSTCDSLNFWECVTAAEHASCRALCTKASSSQRSTFSGCVTSSGSDCGRLGDCYDAFQK